MSKQDLYNVTEKEFIKGIAEGKYTPNDAVAYCRGCFDKVDFLDWLSVYTFALDYPTDRERTFIRRAKDAVYRYLISEGYKFSTGYEFWDIDNSTNSQEFGAIAVNTGMPSNNPTVTKQGLPKCFDTPQGRQIFQNAVDGGLLTNYDYQPTQRATKGRLAIFATELGKKLKITDFNAKCEQFWGIKHLAQEYQKVSAQKNFDDLEPEIKQYFITEE